MKIKSIESFSTKQIGVVRVRTDDGSEGYGQMSAYGSNISAMVLHQLIAQHALGENALEIEELIDKCIVANYKFSGTFICRALAGLDTALWDLRGKLENKSVCELIGGQPRPIDVYGSSMSREITPKDMANKLTKLMDTNGFKAFKIKIGMPFGKDVDQWPGRTEEVIPTVRRAIGDNTVLLADANSCYSPEKAIEVGRMLEEYNVGHYEEPCPYPELEWTAQVTKALDIPVSGGEQDNCLTQWKRMIDMRAVDIVQPNICYIGGLSRSLRVANMAKEAGLTCTPHSANLTMSSVFTLHMLAAIEHAGPYMEFSIEDNQWASDLYHPVLEVKDGKVAIPEGPGWGVTINQNWLQKADYQMSQLN